MTSLNPVFRIGDQVDEVISLHAKTLMSKEDVRARTIELLDMVGIANSEGVSRMFPHELSGGMRQRVMIAMALACEPKVIIADEPTTALDVTIQAQILDLLRQLKDRINSSIMLITAMLAPPCLGPLSEPTAAAIAEYVSVPVDEIRCVVNDELLPPPCSAWSIMQMSRILASKSVYSPIGRSILSMFSEVDSSLIGSCRCSLFLS